MGRVTRDPELRNTPSGVAVVTFAVATNYKYKNGAGERMETIAFHNCVAFGKLASEVIAKYCVKGQEVYVAGRLDYQEWIKNDGSKGHKTQIIVDEFQLGQKPAGAKTSQKEQEPVIEEGEDEEIRVENIPF
jgi:single-strand DNA-binding protein